MHRLRARELARLTAAVVVLLAGLIVVAGSVIGIRACLLGIRRRYRRRMWDDLVARHQELDRELDKIWPRR